MVAHVDPLTRTMLAALGMFCETTILIGLLRSDTWSSAAVIVFFVAVLLIRRARERREARH